MATRCPKMAPDSPRRPQTAPGGPRPAPPRTAPDGPRRVYPELLASPQEKLKATEQARPLKIRKTATSSIAVEDLFGDEADEERAATEKITPPT